MELVDWNDAFEWCEGGGTQAMIIRAGTRLAGKPSKSCFHPQYSEPVLRFKKRHWANVY